MNIRFGGPLTWVAGVLTGAATMLLIEAAFRNVDRSQLAPIAQSIGFFAAWLVAWPYSRQRVAKAASSGFLHYLAAGAVPAFLIAGLRIVLRTG